MTQTPAISHLILLPIPKSLWHMCQSSHLWVYLLVICSSLSVIFFLPLCHLHLDCTLNTEAKMLNSIDRKKKKNNLHLKMEPCALTLCRRMRILQQWFSVIWWRVWCTYRLLYDIISMYIRSIFMLCRPLMNPSLGLFSRHVPVAWCVPVLVGCMKVEWIWRQTLYNTQRQI